MFPNQLSLGLIIMAKNLNGNGIYIFKVSALYLIIFCALCRWNIYTLNVWFCNYILFEKLSLNQHKNICTSNTELWNVIVEQLITLSVSLVDLALDIGHHTNHEMRNWWPQMVSCQMHNLKVSKSQKQISKFSFEQNVLFVFLP